MQVHGQHLRPYLRAQLSAPNFEAVLAPFYVESSVLGEIKLPDLPPGTYTVALLDEVEKPHFIRRRMTVAY